LAKKNSQKGKGHNNNGYFVQNAQKYGEDFHKRKRPDDLRKEAPKIFKDIAFMRGNIGSIIKYFMDYQFVNNIMIVADDEYRCKNATCIGLSTYYNQQMANGTYNKDQRIPEFLNEVTRQTEAYNIITTRLNNILNELDSLKRGKDKMAVYVSIGNYLKSMSISLKDYRYLL